jgi:methylthioribose-1-phosphate isomerase
MEKIKDSKVRHVVFDRLHMVMFMSINPNETIDDFKARGREMVVESFDKSELNVVRTKYFLVYYCQFNK